MNKPIYLAQKRYRLFSLNHLGRVSFLTSDPKHEASRKLLTAILRQDNDVM